MHSAKIITFDIGYPYKHSIVMEEKRVKLSVVGFSFNQTQSGTYGLVLAEDRGPRRLMIVVGAPEAQSIAFKLQNTEPPRPLTHDLFSTVISKFNIELKEVLIYKYEDGVFYSRLIFEQNGVEISIDSRTSDAIGIALRTKSAIFTNEKIMHDLAVVFNIKDDNDSDSDDITLTEGPVDYVDPCALLSEEELASMLTDAIKQEDYELASVLKSELDKRLDR